ncbi:MAG: NAD(P)/FAD-dependent oxidoreductase [bacterium]
MNRYLIIGSGPAALSAIEMIRKRDLTSEILLLSEEPYPPYSRPLISYLLAGKIEEERVFYKGKDFYEKNNVKALLGERAVELDTKEGVVRTSGGKAFAFDKLLIATGGKPIVPSIEGRELKGIFTFTKLDDVKGIGRYLGEEEVEKAVVIGGGLIGLKAMEALMEWGLKITIVELADRILGLTLDRKASSIVRSELERNGVRVITGNTAQELRGRGRIEEVMLRSGEVIPADILIFAIGVRPAVEFLSDSGIAVGRGVIVNEKMETNIPNIYAAGDVAEINNILTNSKQVIAIWPNASEGGIVAGANMLGEEMVFRGGFPMNSVEICGIPTISMGITEPEGNDCEVLIKEENGAYKKIVIREGKIIGAVFVGDIERVGIYCGLMKEGMDVSSFKDRLLEDDFGLIYLPREYRKMKLEAVEI